jgi:hypothetical protein
MGQKIGEPWLQQDIVVAERFFQRDQR